MLARSLTLCSNTTSFHQGYTRHANLANLCSSDFNSSSGNVPSTSELLCCCTWSKRDKTHDSKCMGGDPERTNIITVNLKFKKEGGVRFLPTRCSMQQTKILRVLLPVGFAFNL